MSASAKIALGITLLSANVKEQMITKSMMSTVSIMNVHLTITTGWSKAYHDRQI